MKQTANPTTLDLLILIFMYLTNSQFTLTTFSLLSWRGERGSWKLIQRPRGLPASAQLCFMANETHSVCVFRSSNRLHVSTY